MSERHRLAAAIKSSSGRPPSSTFVFLKKKTRIYGTIYGDGAAFQNTFTPVDAPALASSSSFNTQSPSSR
jgi:hypothetical protein